MQNKKWKKFNKLTGQCYGNMVGMVEDDSCWNQAFELLKEIIREERKMNPGFAPELEMVDEITDYEYDVQGWLEDCLDEFDVRGDNRTLLRMCDDLLDMFGWPEYTGSDIKLRKAAALGALGRNEEALNYCKTWMKKEPENIVAATAGVYAFIGTKEYEAAEKIVDRFLLNKSVCGEENDIMFMAASKLYELMDKKQEKTQIDQALQDYDDYLGQYFKDIICDGDEGFFDEDEEYYDDDLLSEEDLPFN